MIRINRQVSVWTTLCGLLACSLPYPLPAAPVDEAALRARVNEEYSSLEKLYETLHAHPELSFHEKETARRLAEEMKKLGLDVTTNVGGHGVVAVMKNGPGPVVLVRTDMDALPVKEQTRLPYASKVRTQDDAGNEVPVMHACGHDVHMAVWVGTARLLKGLREDWSGSIVFIAQPAEERGAGAKAMLADGLFERFPKPDYAVALHVNAELPAGKIALGGGYVMANVDSVDMTVRGVGGHGAYPHKTKDPVLLAAEIILALQTIVSREIEPTEPAVVTVGSIHGGTKHNIIPEEVKLQLTVRSFTDEVRNQIIESIRRISRGTALAAGIPEDRLPVVSVSDEYTPSLYNDPELAARLTKRFGDLFGADNVVQRKPVMGGEDFARYGRTEDKVPICMFSIGAVDPESVAESERTGKPLPSLHSPLFAPVPEPTIRTGIISMTAAVMRLTGKP